jgi:hypothetical protein
VPLLPEGAVGERRQRAALVDAGAPLGQPAAETRPRDRVGQPGRPGGDVGPARQPAQRVVRARAQPAAVALVQHLGLVGGHVHAGRAVPRAALARQAQVQRLVHLR